MFLRFLFSLPFTVNPNWMQWKVWIPFRFIGILALTYFFVRIVSYLVRRYLRQTLAHYNGDVTRFKFVISFSIFLIYLLGFSAAIYSVPSLRTMSISLFAGAGVLAAILGFASQQAFSNIISGIFIVVFKPFRLNDWVIIEDKYEGVVEDITVRHTVLRDFQNQRIVIPNTQVSSFAIVNMHLNDLRIRKFIELTVDFDSDVDLAVQLMTEEALKHPLLWDARTKEEKEQGKPVAFARFIRFTDLGARLRAVVWARNPDDAWDLACDLNLAFKRAFDANGIRLAAISDQSRRKVQQLPPV